MNIKVNFTELDMRFKPAFGEVFNLSDGGYEQGYDAGYERGSADGYVEGYDKGVVDGKEQRDSWIGDGNTHIWVTLHEGRTSPMLGVCINGTVTVDWGDETEPYLLTGTSRWDAVWTPTHNYAEPGDYIITLTVDGDMAFSGVSRTNEYSHILRHTSGADSRNRIYTNSVQKVEIGNNVTMVGSHSFNNCGALMSIYIPDNVTRVDNAAFTYCYSLKEVICPKSITGINNSAFYDCYHLASFEIPDGVTSIGDSSFANCRTIASFTFPSSVTTISNGAFQNCFGVRYYDFTQHTTIPTLSGTNAFSGIASDCEILVPAELVEAWKTATNWSAYATQIKAGN